MSIKLLGSGNDTINYGDVSIFSGLTQLTFSFTLRPDALTSGNRILSKWGNAGGEGEILVSITATNNLQYVVRGSPTAFWGRKTDDDPIQVGKQARCVLCWNYNSGSPYMRFFVNGKLRSEVSAFTGTVTSIQNGTANFEIGHETDEVADGVDGNYSEVAAWNHEIPVEEAVLITTTEKPTRYRKGLLFYTGLDTIHDINSVIPASKITGSLTGGRNAPRPTINNVISLEDRYYRYIDVTAAPAAGNPLNYGSLSLMGAGI